MTTLQNLDVYVFENGNKYVVKGRTFEDDDFSINVPIDNHVIFIKETPTDFQINRPWRSNAHLRVELHGQQSDRCSVELPFPDIRLGKKINVSNMYVKPIVEGRKGGVKHLNVPTGRTKKKNSNAS